MQDQLDHLPDQERAAELIAGHLQGTLTDSEQQELNAWVGEAPWHAVYFERATQSGHLQDLLATYHRGTDMEAALRASIRERIGATSAAIPVNRVHFIRKQWFRAAAAAIILFGTAGYFWYASSSRNHHEDIVSGPTMPIPAGHQGAILTLEDGRQVTLDSIQNGVLARQKGGEAMVAEGQLKYQPVEGTGGGAIAYNTVTTPKGRQYQFQLPDGTRVWLNAASRISFPMVFNGAERKVTIAGEAYLEVARNSKQPFKVSAGGTTVEVLGTSFNVSAYGDERYIATTLIDGSVKVVGNDAASVVLRPGQQAVAYEGLRVESNIDIEQVIAWKNGIFFFNSTDIHTVMRELSRWYDIDVQYEGKAPNVHVSGKMDKGLNLNEIMEFLTKMDVKFKLTGRTVIINDK